MKTQITHLRHSVKARGDSPCKIVLDGGKWRNTAKGFGVSKAVILHNALQTVPQIVKSGGEVYPYGGVTRVNLIDDNGAVVAFGEAKCCLDDLFCKKKGIQIALGRAEKNLTLANKTL